MPGTLITLFIPVISRFSVAIVPPYAGRRRDTDRWPRASEVIDEICGEMRYIISIHGSFYRRRARISSAVRLKYSHASIELRRYSGRHAFMLAR